MALGMCFGMLAGSVAISILAMFGQIAWGGHRWNWTYDRYDCWIDNFKNEINKFQYRTVR